MSRDRPVFTARLPPRGDVEAFVGRQQPAANGQPLSVPPPAASRQPPAIQPPIEPTPTAGRRRRGIVARAGGVERARVTVYLNVDTAERLRRHAFERGEEISEIAAKAIEQMVSSLS